jgi:integrase
MGRKKKGYKAPEGLIRIGGSPYWWIKITYNGKTTKKSTEIPLENVTKATILLREIQKRILEKEDKAKEILGESISFDELADRYLKEISPGKRSERSDHTNSTHPKEFLGYRRIDTIEQKDVYQFIEWRKSQFREVRKKGTSEASKIPISGSTINREKSFISQCFKKAIRWGYVKANPCFQVEGEKEKKRSRYITDQEFEAIKAEARKVIRARHLPDILDALYLTGLRVGRIFGLKWSQVNLEDRYILFKQTSENKGVPNRLWINDKLLSLLKRLKAERSLQERVGPYVFQKIDGTPYRSIKVAWTRACRKAKVKDAKIHDIRHKTATDLADKGSTSSQIALVLGHSNTSMTDAYTHLQSTRSVLEKLAEQKTIGLA